MIVKLRRPLTWEDKTYTELDVDLEKLTGRDLLAATKEAFGGEPMLSPNTDFRYHAAVAARAAGVPSDMVYALPAPEFTRLAVEVQAFLLGVSAE